VSFQSEWENIDLGMIKNAPHQIAPLDQVILGFPEQAEAVGKLCGG